MAGQQKGWIFVISGPSGSGKTSLLQGLLKAKEIRRRVIESVSLTTRPMRSKEEDGKDYFFVSDNKFKELRRGKRILEWTKYLGYYYATPRDFIEEQTGKRGHIALSLDLNGVRSLKRAYPRNTVTIFISPPSLDALYERIKNRCAKTKKEEISARVRKAGRELTASKEFDYCVVNDDFNVALKKLKNIVLAKIKRS